MVTDFIDRDHFGLGSDKKTVAEGDENIRARAIMEKTTRQRDDGHFETSLLWRDDTAELPSNYAEVRRRHLNCKRGLWKDPVKAQKVTELIRAYQIKGYIRPVRSAGTAGRVWYIPVFTVTHPAKPEKVRLVWDCAAKFKQVSLNSALVSGTDLTVPLVNVLQQFRRGKFAPSGDLEEMFHQVYVCEEDCSAQRFFFRGHPEEELREYEICVLMFSSSCSPTLAQLAKNRNAARFEDRFPEAATAIVTRHYVDDYLDSDHTEEELLSRVQSVRAIHRDGGFNMHKLQANSHSVLQGLEVREPPESEVSLSRSTILGMSWNHSNDYLSFRFSRDRFRSELMNGTATPSRREM